MHLLIQQKYRILQAESGIKDTFDIEPLLTNSDV